MFFPSQISHIDKRDFAKIEAISDKLSLSVGEDARDLIWMKTGQRTTFRPPQAIFGRPANVACLKDVKLTEFKCPNISLYRLQDARIVGSRAVYAKGQLYNLGHHSSLKSLKSVYDQTPATYNGYFIQDDFLEQPYIYCKQRLNGFACSEAIFIHNQEPKNFGSFVFRVLPQLLWLKKLDLNVKRFVVSDTSHWLMEAIQFLFPGAELIEYSVVSDLSFGHLYFFEDFSFEGLYDEHSINLFGEFVRSFSPQRETVSQKIYISRKHSVTDRPSYRPLLNEPEVETYLNQNGYLSIYPERYTFSEQLKLLCYSNNIVTVSGSNCYPLLLSQKAEKILHIESFAFSVRQAYKLFSNTGAQYFGLFGNIAGPHGEFPIYNPWKVSSEVLQAACAEIN